jgi:uncharacterized glyoxalase superfamily protein PhnB
MSDMRLGYVFMWVEDVPAAVAFYEQAFGLGRRVLRENGPMGWYAELETGATTLAIADDLEAAALLPGYRPNRVDDPPGAFQVSFVTHDVAGAHAAAVQAGATSLAEPERQPWGQTIARVRAPHGVLVSLASPPPSF